MVFGVFPIRLVAIMTQLAD